MAASTEHVSLQKKRQVEVEMTFAQRLAGNEKKTRDRAIKKLKQWIIARSKKSDSFSEEDLMKLWKGLYYCMWMSDKPLVQEELAGKIAELTHSFASNEMGLRFFDTCLQTMNREWAGIDYLRIDKFMMMTRKCFTQALVILKQNDWEESLIDKFLGILSKTPLNPDDEVCPNGLRIHIADIYREELGKIGHEELSKEQVTKFIDPFCVLVTATKSKTLCAVILQEFFDEIVTQSDVGMESSDSEDEGIESEEELIKAEIRKKGKKGQAMEQKKKMKKQKEEDKDEEDGEEEEEEAKFADEWEEHLADIPPLEYDYSAISDRLLELCAAENTHAKVRGYVFKMVKRLKDLSAGYYPKPDLVSFQEEVVKREIMIERQLDPDLQEKVHKRNLKRKRKNKENKQSEKLDSDDDSSDEEDEDEEDDIEDDDNDEEVEEKEERQKTKKKRRGKRKKKAKTTLPPGESTAEEGQADGEKKRKRRKRRRRRKNKEQPTNNGQDDGPSPAKVMKINDEAELIKSPLKSLKKSKKNKAKESTDLSDKQSPLRSPKSGTPHSTNVTSENKDLNSSSKVDVSASPIKETSDVTKTPSSARSKRKGKAVTSSQSSASEDITSDDLSQSKSAKKNRRKSKGVQDGAKTTNKLVESDKEKEISLDENVLSQSDGSMRDEITQPKSAKKNRRKSKGAQLVDSDKEKEMNLDKTVSSQSDASETVQDEGNTQPKSSKKKRRKSKMAQESLQEEAASSIDSPVQEEMQPGSAKKRRQEPKVAQKSSQVLMEDATEEKELIDPASPMNEAAVEPRSAKKKRRQSSKALPETPKTEVADSSMKNDMPDTSSQEKVAALPKSAKKKRRKSSEVVPESPKIEVSDTTQDNGAATPAPQPRSAKKNRRQSKSPKTEDSGKEKDTVAEESSGQSLDVTQLKETKRDRRSLSKKDPSSPKPSSKVETKMSPTVVLKHTKMESISTPKTSEEAPAKKTTPEKEITPVSKRTRRKSAFIQAKLEEVESTTVDAKEAAKTPRTRRQSKSPDHKATTPPATPASAKKRVKIALSHNEVKVPRDYQKRVKNSPGIPFDKNKKPAQPALKFTPPTTRARAKVMSTKKGKTPR